MMASGAILLFLHYRPKAERVVIPLEPFFRRHKDLAEYVAFLNWDAKFFIKLARKNSELVRVGVHKKSSFHFPSLKDLLEIKR